MTNPNVFLGDGLDGMLSLRPGSVDLVLTDLPSGETAAEFDNPVDLEKFFRASWHCLSEFA
jgi:DNA modification methylase